MALLGKDVIYADSTFSFDGTPAHIGYQLDGTASSVSMTIRDDNGTTVATLDPAEMKPGNHFLEWDGLDNEGSVVPAGNYHIALQATAAGEDATIAVSPLVQSEVTGVDFNNSTSKAILHTMAGAEISAGLIIAAYQN
jgi:flagellar basal-body rod modification protein FlgD